jgi:four helix bundle protein
MATYKTFEELPIWQAAKKLTLELYKVTMNEKFKKDFYFSEQIRRAILSVSNNIAEGFERGSKKEFIQFLHIARGSVGETRSQIEIAYELGYIDSSQFMQLFEKCQTLSKQINGFIKYLRKT